MCCDRLIGLGMGMMMILLCSLLVVLSVVILWCSSVVISMLGNLFVCSDDWM